MYELGSFCVLALQCLLGVPAATSCHLRLSTNGFGCCPFYGDGSVVDSLYIFDPIVCEGGVVGGWSLFCCAVFSFLSNLAIISLGKKELVPML